MVCNDDDRLRALLPRLARRAVTYGVRSDSDFLIAQGALACSNHHHSAHFKVEYRKQSLGDFHLHVPGTHNILNATSALAVVLVLDLPPHLIPTRFSDF